MAKFVPPMTPPQKMTPSAHEAAARAKSPTVDGEITRCPTCGSTERLRYHRVVTVLLDSEFGVDRDGKKATHRTLKRTSCVKCGTGRTDNFFENRA